MSIRSMLFLAAMGTLGAAGCATDAADSQAQAATEQETGGGFNCTNTTVDVLCHGSILGTVLLPIDVVIKNVGVNVLDGNKLSILSGDLNNVSILDGGILNNDKILNDVEVTTLNDFLNKFVINVSKNDIDVCTSVLGILLCK